MDAMAAMFKERRRQARLREQIRQRCGKELLSRGMFPSRKYFTSAD
jgi:hypothetical protein